MSDVLRTPTAILLVTVWFEPGASLLRARITSTTEAQVPGTVRYLSGREAVLASVRDWLEEREAELRD